MTDAAPARTGPRQAWTIGGILLLVCAGLSVVEPALMFTALFTPVSWARTLSFSAALVVFAVGIRGRGSVVDRRPLGVSALVLLALWPLVDAVVYALVPPTMDSLESYQVWRYVSLLVPLAAAIVAVVLIARAGVVPHPWRWAPLWALGAAIAPQLILQAVAASPGADVQGMAAPMVGLGQLIAVAVPLGLGLCAVLLARSRPTAVQVYPGS